MHRIRLGVQMLTNTKQIQHYNPSLVGQPAVSITLEKGSNPYRQAKIKTSKSVNHQLTVLKYHYFS